MEAGGGNGPWNLHINLAEGGKKIVYHSLLGVDHRGLNSFTGAIWSCGAACKVPVDSEISECFRKRPARNPWKE